MNTEKNISFISDRKHYDIPESSILYVSMKKQDAFIHISDGSVLKTRMTFAELKDTLSANFIRINRGCLVSAMAIHSVGKLIVLSNGESLKYATQHRREIMEKFHMKQHFIIDSLADNDNPTDIEEYHQHYKCFPLWKRGVCQAGGISAGRAYREIVRKHFLQHGFKMAAQLRTFRAVWRDSGNSRLQPRNRQVSAYSMFSDVQRTLRLPSVRYIGNEFLSRKDSRRKSDTDVSEKADGMKWQQVTSKNLIHGRFLCQREKLNKTKSTSSNVGAHASDFVTLRYIQRIPYHLLRCQTLKYIK